MNLKIITVAIGIGILLTITAFGNGFNSAHAKHDTVRVDCKDLAIALNAAPLIRGRLQNHTH